MTKPTLKKQSKSFGGWTQYYEHASSACNVNMAFSVFVPPQASERKVPVVYWLSGLTCTEDNFMAKAGAQRWAAEKGLLLVAPDTSPRGEEVKDDEAYDLGKGAGFYLNATEPGWSKHYRMEEYVTEELPELVKANFPVTSGPAGVMGHSMGGHGALVLSLRYPELYRSVSAFSPICHPTEVPWGKKAFKAYLGEDTERWKAYDACELIQSKGCKFSLLVDQGTDDQFLDEQLGTETLAHVCEEAGVALSLRMQEGYDHSYFFIASFIKDHIEHHARVLNQ